MSIFIIETFIVSQESTKQRVVSKKTIQLSFWVDTDRSYNDKLINAKPKYSKVKYWYITNNQKSFQNAYFDTFSYYV